MLRHSLNHSEVRGCCDVLLVFDELLPVAAFPAFRVGNDPMVIQYLPDGCRRNIVAKIAHRSGYAVIAPIGVSRLEEQNPSDDLWRDRLPAAFTLPLTGAVVLLPHQLLIPVVDRPRGVSLLDDRKQILVQFPPAIRQSFFLFVGIFRPLLAGLDFYDFFKNADLLRQIIDLILHCSQNLRIVAVYIFHNGIQPFQCVRMFHKPSVAMI